MLRYATAERACVLEAGLIKLRRHSLASHFLMRNNFENVKCILNFIEIEEMKSLKLFKHV